MSGREKSDLEIINDKCSWEPGISVFMHCMGPYPGVPVLLNNSTKFLWNGDNVWQLGFVADGGKLFQQIRHIWTCGDDEFPIGET